MSVMKSKKTLRRSARRKSSVYRRHPQSLFALHHRHFPLFLPRPPSPFPPSPLSLHFPRPQQASPQPSLLLLSPLLSRHSWSLSRHSQLLSHRLVPPSQPLSRRPPLSRSPACPRSWRPARSPGPPSPQT